MAFSTPQLPPCCSPPLGTISARKRVSRIRLTLVDRIETLGRLAVPKQVELEPVAERMGTRDLVNPDRTHACRQAVQHGRRRIVGG